MKPLSFFVFVIAILANLSWWYLMLRIQQIESHEKIIAPRGSFIPGTSQKFLYLQDFYSMLYGDLIGISLINGGFWYSTTNNVIMEWKYFIITALLAAIGFTCMYLRSKHKPDCGCPTRRNLSVLGVFHVFYFGFNFAVCALAGWHIFWTGKIQGMPLRLIIGGSVFYTGTFITDFLLGNFNDIEPFSKSA